MNSLTKAAAPPTAGLTAADFRKAWGYQLDQVAPEGSWLVDLDCMNPGKPKVHGCSKVTGLILPIGGDECDLTISLKGVVRSPINGRLLPISTKEKQILIQNAQLILACDQIVPLPKALEIIDKR
jgi:hypothetical protein